MKKKRKNKWFWLPRIIAVAFIVFITLFALDVFSEGYSFWVAIGAFLIHLVPTYFLLAAYLIARKNPKIGAYIYIGIAIIFTIWFNTYREFITFILLSLPLLILGILFYLDYKFNVKKKH